MLQDSVVMKVLLTTQGTLWSPPRRVVARLASHVNMCGEYASWDQVDQLIELAKGYVNTKGRLNHILF